MMQKLILLLSALISTVITQAQETKVIKFKQEKLAFHPTHFYIDSIKDDRADTTNIGTVRAGALTKKMVSLNLPGGAAAGIRAFLQDNLTQDTHTVPVTMHLLQLEAAEQTGGLKSESEVRMTVAFYIKGNKIVEYKGSNSVQAGLDATRFVEELIRRNLDNVIQQFDGWMNTHQQQVQAIVSGPAVQVSVVLKDAIEEDADTDKIAWSLKRPLELTDFQGKVDDLSRAGAATYSGMDVRLSQQQVYGQVQVEVMLTPYFDKSRSWCRPTTRTAKTLQHEQLHFTITAIKACELAAAIRNFSFTAKNYTNELQQLYRQKEKEIQQQQDLYDTETQHGLIVAEQTKWEKTLADQLAAQACYHP